MRAITYSIKLRTMPFNAMLQHLVKARLTFSPFVMPSSCLRFWRRRAGGGVRAEGNESQELSRAAAF
ncbi:MAG: hypothetical protein IJK84_07180 [Bacteroidales bacterium]|nr:hypothetical protein [Bacteroidales bacterium]